MSLIGRIGGGSELYGYSKNYVIGHGFDLEIEPRYYLNDEDFFLSEGERSLADSQYAF